jgi:hypothetical protein
MSAAHNEKGVRSPLGPLLLENRQGQLSRHSRARLPTLQPGRRSNWRVSGLVRVESEWLLVMAPWILLLAFWAWIFRVLGTGRIIRAAGSDGAAYLFERKGICRQTGAVTVTVEWAAVTSVAEVRNELLIRAAAEYEWRVLLPADQRARRAMVQLLSENLGARARAGLLRPGRGPYGPDAGRA